MLEFCVALSEGYLEKDDAIIFVSMDTSPADVISMMETFGLPMAELLGKRVFFLDYHSCLLGSSMDRSECIDGVRNISDLEGIMFNISAIAKETGKRVRIFFHSLSTLFLYNQSNVVLKFFQITCSRVRSEYGTAIVAVHEGVHDERTVNHLMAIADGTIELRFAVARSAFRRLSSAGNPSAMPSSIHARLRFKPSRCASFPSEGSVVTPTGSHAADRSFGIDGRNASSHPAKLSGGRTRRTRSASARHGDRKSCPEGSYESGQARSFM